MNKQLIQDIIKAGNKAIDNVPVKYAVETKGENYQVYNGIYYDDNHIEFVDDYDDDVYLEYDKVVGIKVSQCVTKVEKVEDSVAYVGRVVIRANR